MKKIMVMGIIFLLIGVIVAPSINQSVVTASQEDDLVEVTMQACGIQGYGDTTVKLTREQYQNLEQYLVEFRARLNQTTTREVAIPLFKEAVVELDRYGLLPKGMSIEQAQRLIVGKCISPRNKQIFQDKTSNYFCLTFVKATHALVNTILLTMIVKRAYKVEDGTTFLWKLLRWAQENNNHELYDALIMSIFFVYISLISCIFLGTMVFGFSPIYIGASIGFGFMNSFTHGYSASQGMIFTLGLNGIKIWQGTFRGDLNINFYGFMGLYYPGIAGFTGFHLYTLNDVNYYLGASLMVKMTTELPD